MIINSAVGARISGRRTLRHSLVQHPIQHTELDFGIRYGFRIYPFDRYVAYARAYITLSRMQGVG